MPFRLLIAKAVLVLSATSVPAHEVWIEPLSWQITQDEVLAAHLRNGEIFSGVNLSWNDRSIRRAERVHNGESAPLKGRAGDIPAFNLAAPSPGLLTLVYQSGHRTITYRTYEKFVHFVTGKGYEEVLAEHAARGLPEVPIKEAYMRFAKALVAVGEGRGQDAAQGLELEIVALDNPYTDDLTALRFQVSYQGAPLTENQVTIFARDLAGDVTTILKTTNADGQITFGADPGWTYLVDTVLLREPAQSLVEETNGAVWESLWASLTFRAAGAR